MRINTGYGGERPRPARGAVSMLQGELGSFVVSCERADMRLVPDGVAIYSTEGLRVIAPEPWRGVPGRGNVIDELYYAVTQGRPLVHHGRWAKATTEVCLAVLESAREHKEIALHHQVPLED